MNRPGEMTAARARDERPIGACARDRAPRVVPLTSLSTGATARLHEARLDPASRASLRALGLTDASVLRVCKHGDPYIVEVRATRIGLARHVARHIFVTALGDGDGL